MASCLDTTYFMYKPSTSAKRDIVGAYHSEDIAPWRAPFICMHMHTHVQKRIDVHSLAQMRTRTRWAGRGRCARRGRGAAGGRRVREGVGARVDTDGEWGHGEARTEAKRAGESAEGARRAACGAQEAARREAEEAAPVRAQEVPRPSPPPASPTPSPPARVPAPSRPGRATA